MADWIVPGYSETRELGAGAGGRVVHAVHEATGTPVAVKYLSQKLRRDAGFREAFRAEAELLAGLTSPFVTGLYEYVEGPSGAAIVMELVDGVALRRLLQREGATGPEAALAVLKGSLLGLAAAHAAGVVHRDYKPENVLVTADGVSKLVDFGISARTGERVGASGTPVYMAPEQWNGGPATPATDVYAATACFFECLTGRKAYTGQNLAELAVQHIEAPVPDELVPEPVRDLVRRGLAKDPAERPSDAAAFVAELDEVAERAYGPRWESRGRRRLAALAALVPLLFPSALGQNPGGVTTFARTVLRSARGHHGWVAGLAAGLVAALLFGAAAAAGTGGHRAQAQTVATTEATSAAGPATAGPAGPATGGPTPDASGTGDPADLDGDPDGTDGEADGTEGADGDADADGPDAPDLPGEPGGPGGGDGPGEPPGPGGPGGPGGGPGAPGGGPGEPPAPGSSPPPTVAPPAGPSTPPPAGVDAVEVGSLVQTGPQTASASVTVRARSTGPVVLTLAWYADEFGQGGQQDGATQTLDLSGDTSYTVQVAHTFATRTACFWEVRASTSPAAANGGSSQRVTTRGCLS
ncbi:serine/threonine-protein kinase [Streptomyces sp. 549]|uniref:serine/threonine-protein kinase n=1 Tax=Streptomyces sp. 549 TaxID=3049076 RepID=UPI0024C335C4|nr:serine/threonine-protein kinase [Streptomyces sp. 549]MDK1474302.1 serine/threonine-protein kinase [Streptomyces sp. 549]